MERDSSRVLSGKRGEDTVAASGAGGRDAQAEGWGPMSAASEEASMRPCATGQPRT